jgi:hypothetical protein
MTRNYRIRFCANNFAADAAATLTASSAQAAFPLSNLTNDLRFKVWKPAGNFTISDANNKVYINDGADKTVTLTNGNYAYSALATHIQTQLNASSSGWTVSYSTTTYKFTVGRASGTALLRFSQTTNAVWDAVGYTGSSDTDAGTGLAADEQRNHTSEYVDIDLGVGRPITFFALVGRLTRVFSLSSTATVRLYGNTVASMASPALTVTLSPETFGIYHFLDDLADTTYRYWRLECIDRTNPAGPEGFEFGHLYLGDYTTINFSNVQTGFSKTLVDTAVEQVSEGGASFFQDGFKYLSFDSTQIANMTAADRRDLEQVFYDLGRSTPFYVSFDPTLGVSTELSELTRYVVFSQDPVFTNVIRDVYTVSMAFKEVM